jgi:RNA polymerase sigma-70 factor (ECF subfamily)
MSQDLTSLSLLDRLTQQPDPESWRSLTEIYTSLIKAWLRRYHIQESDADDLIQEVLTVLSQELPQFRHTGRPGSFRAWLRTILVHRLRNYWRSHQRRPEITGGTEIFQQLQELEDPQSSLSQIWDEQHDKHVIRHLLDASRGNFAHATWQAFWRIALEGAKPADVALELGLSINAVLIAKSRVLSHLKRQARGLVD